MIRTNVILSAILCFALCVATKTAAGQTVRPNRVPAGDRANGAESKSPSPIPIRGVSNAGNGQFQIRDQVRPLAVAARLLERKLGVPVSYEDAEWQNVMDLRAGTMDVALPATAAALQAPNYVNLIEGAIRSYGNFGNSGDFVLRRFGESEFSIVPATMLTTANQTRGYVSPLDMKISFPAADRSLSETIDLIYKTIKDTGRGPISGQEPLSGRPQYAWDGPVLTGNHTLPYFKGVRVTVGANDEVARNVLAKALRIPGQHKVSWSMLYAPNTRQYFVNLSGVQVEVRDISGDVQLSNIFWPK